MERPATARDRSSRLLIAVLFNIAPDNTDMLAGTALRFSERFCAVTTISSREPELSGEAASFDVAWAGSADAVAAKHIMIAVEHVSRLKLREPLVTDMPPIFRKLSGNGSSFLRGKPSRRRLSLFDIDLPGFCPAVRPDAVSRPDGIS